MSRAEEVRSRLAEAQRAADEAVAGGDTAAAVAIREAPPGVLQVLGQDHIQKRLEKALVGASGLTPERFTALVAQVVRANPQLLQCEPLSVISAAVTAAQLGLEPGPMEQAYIVPFWSPKHQCHQAQFIIGYRGIIDLAYRSGFVTRVEAHAVRDGDTFDFSRGTGELYWMQHKPPIRGDRGEVIGYYGIAEWLVQGHLSSTFEYRTVEELVAHRDAYVKDWQRGPWRTNFDGMARKTMIRGLSPWIPKSARDLHRALHADETVATDFDEDMVGRAYIEREQQRQEERAGEPDPAGPVQLEQPLPEEAPPAPPDDAASGSDEPPAAPSTTNATVDADGRCLGCGRKRPDEDHADGCDVEAAELADAKKGAG